MPTTPTQRDRSQDLAATPPCPETPWATNLIKLVWSRSILSSPTLHGAEAAAPPHHAFLLPSPRSARLLVFGDKGAAEPRRSRLLRHRAVGKWGGSGIRSRGGSAAPSLPSEAPLAVSARAAVPEARAAGPRHHRRLPGAGAGSAAERWLAGIIGAGRSWTAWMILVLSIPCRYAEVIPRSGCPSWRPLTSRGIPSRDISMNGTQAHIG